MPSHPTSRIGLSNEIKWSPRAKSNNTLCIPYNASMLHNLDNNAPLSDNLTTDSSLFHYLVYAVALYHTMYRTLRHFCPFPYFVFFCFLKIIPPSFRIFSFSLVQLIKNFEFFFFGFSIFRYRDPRKQMIGCAGNNHRQTC